MKKENYVKNLGFERVAALGNGMNDRMMLKTAKIGIAIIGRERCAVDSLTAADVQVRSVEDGLDLLLNPGRLKATIQF